MKERKWPFGKTFDVIVESADKNEIMVIALLIKEVFVLLGHGLKNIPKNGDLGRIRFERGGLKGGYWQYYPNTVK